MITICGQTDFSLFEKSGAREGTRTLKPFGTGPRVLVLKPRLLRSAFVSQQASDDMPERVQHHFRIA